MNRIREFIDEYLYQILIGLVGIIVVFFVCNWWLDA